MQYSYTDLLYLLLLFFFYIFDLSPTSKNYNICNFNVVIIALTNYVIIIIRITEYIYIYF